MLFPLIGRLAITDYIIILMVYTEFFVYTLVSFVPQKLISATSWLFQQIFTSKTVIEQDDTKDPIEVLLRTAPTIHEMCAVFDIQVHDHLVRTEDDYILTLHRIPPDPRNSNGKVAYLHHGLLMCSDVWVCNIERNKNLPFVLHDMGYDVWMGNNRGNKYSTAHLYKLPRSPKFWDFSIDEFAFFDIPNSIKFVLEHCKVNQLVCIGFSQGSAQMFAALSINEELNSKISQFVAIAPAMTPHGLHNRIVDTLAKSTPKLMYLFFGRNIVLPSATLWRRTLHPKLFNMMVDMGNVLLFNWTAKNITYKQKFVSYSKLYSTTSVKSIVHWFQILRSQKFQLFEEPDDMFNSLSRPYRIPVFPTKTNIKVPILLIYGGIDSLVDIEVMKSNLPTKRVFDIKVEDHEHLDLIWGHDVDKLVIDKVIKFIDFFTPTQQSLPSVEQNVPSVQQRLMGHIEEEESSDATTTHTLMERLNSYTESEHKISISSPREISIEDIESFSKYENPVTPRSFKETTSPLAEVVTDSSIDVSTSSAML
ncbi:hypothetical protein Kpol_297p4 [Vanderwaltozyma polyspora DSM 70294]|uniref:AB hydrolase-1 domain-containing protein n=1 Tax=Vanderwaltozyma polyspora (strain ATCC 22028 / DSM 70294 / BCRC 21397 / CBS 2163 / NBRC 10782 / NRRL Y-8283 / UCD 57-17) TaxID=436907 RepID=A7TSK8_VANPO|nr:uncharacterized protein Kpol_297p4 [Vanderwaltozyma polyspora DSM 70294]EDO14743.1 hypothetical protein Kpol_297p4 [Vanderwaltozyma polyspora DSM 70294]